METEALIAQLREAGHQAEAESLERKLSNGRDEEPGGGKPERDDPATVPAFGASEQEEVAAVVAALDRDVPGWRGV
jgi:hypothetical protein